MKTVIIPTCANPFVVIVNGIKYTYPAGETMEVPDDVAAVIEQHDVAHSKHEPAPVVPPFAPGDGVDDVTLAAAKAYTDEQRLAYEEVKRDYLLENLSFAEYEYSGIDYPEGYRLKFDSNKVYRLTFNGETYSVAEFLHGYLVFYVRHPADNNIMVGFLMNDGRLNVYDQSGIDYDWANSGLSVSLYIESTEVHTIDPKFMPKGSGLSMVVLSTEPTSNSAKLTSEECAAIQVAYDNGSPCIIQYSTTETFTGENSRTVTRQVTEVFRREYQTDTTGRVIMQFEANSGDERTAIYRMDGFWYFYTTLTAI